MAKLHVFMAFGFLFIDIITTVYDLEFFTITPYVKAREYSTLNIYEIKVKDLPSFTELETNQDVDSLNVFWN